MFHDPIEKSPLETNVVFGFLALKPFMSKNFFALGQKLFVQSRASNKFFSTEIGFLSLLHNEEPCYDIENITSFENLAIVFSRVFSSEIGLLTPLKPCFEHQQAIEKREVLQPSWLRLFDSLRKIATGPPRRIRPSAENSRYIAKRENVVRAASLTYPRGYSATLFRAGGSQAISVFLSRAENPGADFVRRLPADFRARFGGESGAEVTLAGAWSD